MPLLATGTDPLCCRAANVILVVSGLSRYLQQTGSGAPGPIVVEFGSAGMRHRSRSGTGELLGKAVGRGKKPALKVLDATAGLGRDAFVLADLGCEVALCEREPAIVELLRSGMQIASGSGDPWLAGVTGRMHLRSADARQLDASEVQGTDVIYLDPMFPPRAKSAAVKKEMALFQRLLERPTDPQDADALLHWALEQDIARVVVKRPARAPHLGALLPTHCTRGKSVRYDVYVRRKLL